ncbi:MAG: lytic transglycosylase domain-containing protein [Sulfobacillus sp.]
MAKRKKTSRTGRWVILLGLLILAVFSYRYFLPWPYRATVLKAAQQNQISPYLVAAVIRVESGFRPNAVSGRGAVGLMQIMPQTAQWIGAKTGQHNITAENLTQVDLNVELGTWYLHHLLTLYHGNLVLALASYNSGPRTVATWLTQGVLHQANPNYLDIPYPETRNFVYRVMTYKHFYRVMYAWTISTNTEAWGW